MHNRLPVAAIYRDRLLPPSETFILRQGESLTRYSPLYVGSRRVPGLAVPEDRVIVGAGSGLLGLARELICFGLNLPKVSVRSLSRRHPAIIHAHFGPDGVSALPLAKALGIPLVVTFHGYDATVRDEFARRSFIAHRHFVPRRHLLAQEADLFIAVSDFVKRRLLDQGFPAEKTRRHYIGVDTDFFQPFHAIERSPIVLFVGRLVEVKGCEHLIRAATMLQRCHRDFKLVIIGDGPLRQTLSALAGRLGCRCSFLGLVNQEEVREWMNRARVFCVPSVESESGALEAFGMAFLEAQSMGLPVVSYSSGGIPEAVKHGETGLLAEAGNVAELAEYLALLLDNEELWRSMSRAGFQRTRAHFDIRQQTTLLEDMYDSVRLRFERRSTG